jgi:hypothetical protein
VGVNKKDDYWFSGFSATWCHILAQNSDCIETSMKKECYRNIFTFSKGIYMFSDVNFGANLSLKIVKE